MKFFTNEKEQVEVADYLRNFFKNKEGKLYKGLYELWLGCDSSYLHGGWSQFATVACIRTKQSGVRVLHQITKIKGSVKPIPHLTNPIAKKNLIFTMVLERLWQEVLEVEKLINHLKKEEILLYKNPEDEYLSAFTDTIQEIVVHIDFNGHEEHLSSHLTNAAISYFAALGIKTENKPEAFAATYAAHNCLTK